MGTPPRWALTHLPDSARSCHLPYNGRGGLKGAAEDNGLRSRATLGSPPGAGIDGEGGTVTDQWLSGSVAAAAAAAPTSAAADSATTGAVDGSSYRAGSSGGGGVSAALSSQLSSGSSAGVGGGGGGGEVAELVAAEPVALLAGTAAGAGPSAFAAVDRALLADIEKMAQFVGRHGAGAEGKQRPTIPP